MLKHNSFIRSIYFLYLQFFGYRKKTFGYFSRQCRMTPPVYFNNPSNVYIYMEGNIGPCYVTGKNAKFIIKKGCAIGPHLEVHTGNHARIVGTMVGYVSEDVKPKGYDKDVVVEEDVWIGCNVTLLSGVTIGRGATVAAGSVVNRDLPPYTLCAGIPAKVKKMYWSVDQILEHERAVYPPDQRKDENEIQELFRKYGSFQ